jgi:Peptidase family M50
MVAMYLGMHARILAHELGHLLAAKVCRFRECKIQVGVGALLWSHVFSNGLLFEWRASTRAGWVVALPQSKNWLRLRQLAFVLAGPLTDLFLICLGYICLTMIYGRMGAGLDYGVAGVVMLALFWWTVLSAISGAIPHGVNIGGRTLRTDGYWILQLLLGRPIPLADWANGFDRARALEMLQSDTQTGTAQLAVAPDASCSVGTFQEQQTLFAQSCSGPAEVGDAVSSAAVTFRAGLPRGPRKLV